MGKHLWTEDADEQIANNQPGCVRGVLHALDYHHWHYNVKKLLPHKKHNGPRHVKGSGGYSYLLEPWWWAGMITSQKFFGEMQNMVQVFSFFNICCIGIRFQGLNVLC